MTLDQMTTALTARLDGPHDDDDTAAAGWLAAECVRYLNYATREAGLTYPATAYAVTGALAAAASGLDQLTRQITAFLDRELAAARLGEDHGGDPADCTGRARMHLAAAAEAADALATMLSHVQGDLSSLHQARNTPATPASTHDAAAGPAAAPTPRAAQGPRR